MAEGMPEEPPEFAARMAEKRYAEAVKVAQKMAETAKGAGNVVEEGTAEYFAAKALFASGASNEAIEVAQTAATCFKEFGDKTKQGAAMQLLAEACLAAGFALDSRDVAEQALILFRQSKYKPGQGKALITMASAQTELGEFGKAAYRAEQASELFKSITEPADAAEAMRVASVSFMQRKAKDKEAGSSVAREALRTANTAVKMLETAKATNSEGYGKAVQTVAAAYLVNNDLEQATQKANEAQAIFQTRDSSAGMASCLMTLAEVFFQKGDLLEASSSARQAQTLYDDAQDDKGSAEAAALMAKFQQGPGEQIQVVTPAKAEPESAEGISNYRVEIRKLVPGIEKAIVYAEYDAYQGRSATTATRARPKSEREAERAALAEVTRDQAAFSVRWVRQQPPHGDSLVPPKVGQEDEVLRYPMTAPAPGNAMPAKAAKPMVGPRRGEIPYSTGQRVLPKEWATLFAN